MRQFDDLQILMLLVETTRWTILLSLTAFAGGALLGGVLTVMRIMRNRLVNLLSRGFTALIQSTPLLMLLFLSFFGLPLVGLDVPAWGAAAFALIVFTAAFLADIWQSAVRSVPSGQWDAARAMGLGFLQSLRLVIIPQAIRIATPSTVGFSVQVVKGTALASIIGFVELTKAGTMLNNVTFKPFFVFSIVALLYFALCFPLSLLARRLERRASESHA